LGGEPVDGAPKHRGHDLKLVLNPGVEGAVIKAKGLRFIDFFEAWGEGGFDRALAEDLGAERVDSADVGLFETGESVFEKTHFFGKDGGGACFVEFDTKAEAEFAGGFPGEGDGDDAIDRCAAGSENGYDALDEFGGFSGAGGRLDDEALVEGFANALSGGGVVGVHHNRWEQILNIPQTISLQTM
jgi:hypothetical protein